MKYFPLILFFTLFLAFAVSAQTNQTANCPTIDVSGGDVVEPGKPITFTSNIEKYDLSKLSFHWTVSKGEISEGQGTLSIKVLTKDDGKYIIAVVEVKGLPEGCPNTAAETEAICSCFSFAILVDEFSIQASQIDKARLDDFVNEIEKKPDAQAYIMEYFKPGTPKRIIKQKIRKIADYLVNKKKLEKERITISTVFEYEQNLTKFWIVPPGAEIPQP